MLFVNVFEMAHVCGWAPARALVCVCRVVGIVNYRFQWK